jgi:hypothetical protein
VIEPNWRANTFGTYNGDGYLLYPGPNGALWSSMRLENLRDGIEDYEMLALLRDRASRAKARGENVAGVEKLLAIDDALCRAVPAQGVAWPAYTQESQALLAARRAIAQALLRLKD